VSQTLRERLLGAWHLRSQETVYDDGRREWTRGIHPRGIIFYDSSGFMSVHLMRTDAEAVMFFDLREETQALSGYVGYFGQFTVDESQQMVLHNLTGASYAPWTGTTLRRTVQLDGDTLILSARWDAAQARRLIVWERQPPYA
jgi:hypothetical protein